MQVAQAGSKIIHYFQYMYMVIVLCYRVEVVTFLQLFQTEA